jgi:spermidine/putrescine transport system ATP-binding protein
MTETDESAMDAATASAAEPGAGHSVPAIALDGVVKEFHARGEVITAVRGLDLAIKTGEFFSLLGPSGCGKTTTMRMVAGFEEPTRGVVRLDGRDVTADPPHKRDVNMVFQSYALFPHLSVFENVAFGLRRKSVPKDRITQQVGQMLDIVDLAGREQRRPRELSGGQQQRVALARALVNHPKALLLDEPLGALDLKLRQAMQVELKRIQREVGITFVYVTHDQNEALTMSDRIAVMNDGVIEQLGPPREIYEHPATRFVAGFIGTSNVLTGTLARVTDGLGVIEVSPDERIVIPAGQRGLRPREEVELTVRPEKIELRTGPPGPGSGCALRGKVTEVVYLGTSTSFSVHTTTGADVVVFQQNSASAGSPVSRGDDVWLTWDPEHSYPIG